MSYKKVYIELTNRCNLNCSICYRRSWHEKPQDMEDEMILSIYEETKGRDVEIVLGGIGEPTCSPNIYKAIELFKNHKLTLTTNGTLLDEKLRAFIIGKVDKLVVSIDGCDEKFHEIRGFDIGKLIDNLHALNVLKTINKTDIPQLVIEFVASKDNIDGVFGVIDLASELNASNLIVSNLIPQNIEDSNQILYTRYENQAMKEYFHKIRIHSFKKGIIVTLPNIELKTERRCAFIDNDAIVISSDGNVAPCYRFLHDTTEYIFERKKEVKKFSFGNISNSSISDIYNSTQYKNFRSVIYNNLFPSCMDCDLVDGCDFIKTSEHDCNGMAPSCADCVWSRGFTICP